VIFCLFMPTEQTLTENKALGLIQLQASSPGLMKL